MTKQSGTLDSATRIKDLEEINELLLLQVHQAQEELEVYFVKCKRLEAGLRESGTTTFAESGGWVIDELAEALAEVERLKTLVLVQSEIKSIENRNALNIKLGDMLLKSCKSQLGLIKLPFRLLSFWRKNTLKYPPTVVGGKDFVKVINVYDEKGFDGVVNMLDNIDLPPIIKANAYTVLARHLMKLNAKSAAEAAFKSFENDPKPFRLKWLAGRVHEAGDPVRAEAILELLPIELSYSESEKKQFIQIRHEAKKMRRKHALQKIRQPENEQQNIRILEQHKNNVKLMIQARKQLESERKDKSKKNKIQNSNYKIHADLITWEKIDPRRDRES